MVIMKVSLFLVLIAVTATLAENYYAETPMKNFLLRRLRINGGHEAVPHSIPFQVAIYSVMSFGGGSLISKRHVLTAAHSSVLKQNPTLVLGAHNVKKKEPEQVIMTMKNIKIHEKYESEGRKHNIAIIELPQDAPINQYIQTVKLAPPNSGLFVGAAAQVSGWGNFVNRLLGFSPVLRVVESTVLTNEECEKLFNTGLKIFPYEMCLDGSELKKPAGGDDGCPLFTKHNNETIQIGVASKGLHIVIGLEFPTVFTRLSVYSDWISKNSDYKY